MSLRSVALLAVAALGSAAPAKGGDEAEGTGHRGAVTALARQRDTLYSASQAGVFVTERGRERQLCRPTFRVVAIAVLSEAERGARLLVAGGEPGISGSVAMVSAEGKVGEERRLAEDLVYAAAVEPPSDVGVRRAAFACADGRVLLAELPALAKVEVAATHTAAARSLSFSPDGAVLASGGRDGVVVLSRLRGEGERTKALPEHTAGVECVSFSPDGSRLASGSRDGRVRLHGGDGRYLRAFEPLRGEVLSLAWSEDGSAVAAGTSRGEVHALPVDPERPPRLLAAHPFPVTALLELGGGGLAAGGVGKVLRVGWGE